VVVLGVQVLAGPEIILPSALRLEQLSAFISYPEILSVVHLSVDLGSRTLGTFAIDVGAGSRILRLLVVEALRFRSEDMSLLGVLWSGGRRVVVFAGEDVSLNAILCSNMTHLIKLSTKTLA